MAGDSPRLVRFEEFELDFRAEELRRGGQAISLPPQQFTILSALVEAQGALVTREELRTRLWGDDAFVDFDAGLNFCIRQLRHALGDAAAQPRFIQTVPRRGYRFVAAVVPTPVLVAEPIRRRNSLAPVLAVTLLAAVVAATAWSFAASSAEPPTLSADARIADMHSAQGFVALNDDWSWTAADRSFSRALTLDPRHEVALISMSRLRASQGQFAEAIEFARRAVAAHPLSGRARTTLGWTLLFSGEAEAARQTCEEARGLGPASGSARHCQFHAEVELGLDLRSRWLAAMDRLAPDTPRGEWFLRATIEARLGRRADATSSLVRALAEHEPDATFALVHPAFAGFRNDPAFVAATSNAGLALIPRKISAPPH